MSVRISAALAVLVLLAGCTVPLVEDAGDAGGPNASQPVPDAPELTYPAAISEDGSVNATEIARATFGAMNETVVRIDHRNGNDSRVVYFGPSYSYSRSSTGATWSGPNRSVSNDTWDDADYSLDYYQDVIVPSSAGGPMRFGLVIRLSSGRYERVGTETIDGEQFHEIELVRPSGLGASADHYEVSALVDGDGRLRRMTGEVGDSETNATAFRYEFDWTADRVRRPSWVDAVPRFSATKAADNRSLVVTLERGPSIPADETFRFSHNGTGGEVTLQRSLDPGESLYFAVNGTGYESEAVATRQPGDREGMRSLATDRISLDGTVTLADGTTVSIEIDVGRLVY